MNVEHFCAPGAAVLMVDDSRLNLRVMKCLLANYEIEPLCATGGADALKQLARGVRCQLVLMDQLMPEMDGVQTLRAIRALEATDGADFARLPVVALSTPSMAEPRAHYRVLGFDDFLEKPASRAELERVLLGCLPPDEIKWVRDIDERTQALLSGLRELDLARATGEARTYLSSLQIFAGRLNSWANRIDLCTVTSDLQEATLLAYDLKCDARLLGATAIAAAAEALERCARAAQTEALEPCAQALVKACTRFLRELEPVLETLRAAAPD